MGWFDKGAEFVARQEFQPAQEELLGLEIGVPEPPAEKWRRLYDSLLVRVKEMQARLADRDEKALSQWLGSEPVVCMTQKHSDELNGKVSDLKKEVARLKRAAPGLICCPECECEFTLCSICGDSDGANCICYAR